MVRSALFRRWLCQTRPMSSNDDIEPDAGPNIDDQVSDAPEVDEPDVDEPEVDEPQVDEPDSGDPDSGELDSGDPDPGEVRAFQFNGKSLLGDEAITYDCSVWAGETRAWFASMLVTADVPHTWTGTTLSVAAAYEDEVDELVDEAQATAVAALDAERDTVVYSVGDWSAALQTSLAESLTIAEIPYEWDEMGDLKVYADDEERVDGIFDAMPEPEDAEFGDVDGVVTQDTLSRLWDAAGSLARHPRDADAVVAAADLTVALARMPLPFGFDRKVWNSLNDGAGELLALLDADAESDDPPDDDAVSGAARRLADMIRPLV